MKILRTATALIIIFFVSGTLAAPNSSPQLSGIWIFKDIDAGIPEMHIQILERNSHFYGKIVAVADKKGKESRRITKRRKYLSYMTGMVILWDLKYSVHSGKFTGGKIYDPIKEKSYPCSLIMIERGTKLQITLLRRKKVIRQLQWMKMNNSADDSMKTAPGKTSD